MFKKNLFGFFLLFFFVAGWSGESFASEKFGFIFDIQGSVRIKNPDGKIRNLKKDTDILYPVKEDDRIEVSSGKLVIVSMKENKGYEISANSTGHIRDNKMVAVKGRISILEGLHSPSDSSRGPIGGLVLRGSKPCLKAISPVDTAVLELTPELRWENKCQDSKKVFVKILSDDKVISDSERDAGFMKVPQGLLNYGHKYRWIVDNGKSSGITGGAFSIPKEDKVASIKENIAFMNRQKNNLPQRLSYVFYLIDKNLTEQAKTELEILQKEFPENAYIRNLSETGSVEQ